MFLSSFHCRLTLRKSLTLGRPVLSIRVLHSFPFFSFQSFPFRLPSPSLPLARIRSFAIPFPFHIRCCTHSLVHPFSFAIAPITFARYHTFLSRYRSRTADALLGKSFYAGLYWDEAILDKHCECFPCFFLRSLCFLCWFRYFSFCFFSVHSFYTLFLFS